MEKRLYEYDYLKAFCALSVILIHITALYIDHSRPGYYLNQLVRYAVPMFIVISGALLQVSQQNKKMTYGSFLTRRFNKILIPYLIWTAVYMLYSLRNSLDTVSADVPGFLLDLGKRILLGTGYSHLYFVIIILQLYLLFPLLKKGLEKSPEIMLGSCLILTLAFQTGVYLHLQQILVLPRFFIPYYIFFPTWVFYFVFGMYFTGAAGRWKGRIEKSPLLPGILWLASLVLLLADSRITHTYASSIKPSVMLYCILSFLFFYSLAVRLTRYTALNGAAQWISLQSFTLYLSHLLILSLITYTAGKLGLSGIFKGSAGMLLLYAATCCSTLLFVYLAAQTPLAPHLGGAYTFKPLRHGQGTTRGKTFGG